MLGLINSNYAGIYGNSINPSGMVASKLYMDYNLLSLNASARSNYMLIERSDFVDLLYNGITPTYYTDEHEERNFNIYRDRDRYFGFQSIRANGPGGMAVYGDHAFALTSTIRSQTSFTNLPNDMALFIYEAIDYKEQQGILWSHDEPIRVGSLSWLEIGLSYAYNFRRFKWEYWSIGITLKPMIGISAFYANLNTVDYFVQHDDTAYIDKLNFDYSYALPISYSDNSYEGPLFRGFGLGVDLGITYMYTTRGHTIGPVGRICGQRYEDYNIKIGFSVLDLGYIKFGNKAAYRSYINTSTDWYRNDERDKLPAESIDDINYKLDQYFEANAEEAIEENGFTLYTPAAMSIQADYHYKKHIYFNATVIYGLPLGRNVVRRTSVIALTPRYEKLRLEFALPISFLETNFAAPGLGFYFRYGNFFLGTNDFTSIIGLKDFTGFDFYFGLRLNLSRNLRMDYFKGNCGDVNYYNIETFDYRNF